VNRPENLVLSWTPGTTHHPQPGGDVVLRHADSGTYVTVPGPAWLALQDVDGRRTLSEVVRAMLERGAGLSLPDLLAQVRALRDAGLLRPCAPGLPRARRPWGRWAWGPRLPLPAQPRAEVPVLPWVLVATVMVTLGVLGTALAAVPPGTPGPVLLHLWLATAVLLSVRAGLDTAVLLVAGTRPWRLGLAFSVWVPHLWADPRDARAAGPRVRASLALADLLVPVLGLSLATWAAPWLAPVPGLLDGLLAASAALLWWSLRPWGDSPLAGLARALSGSRTVLADARAYLWRRMAGRWGGGGTPWPREALWLLLALWHVGWAYAGLRLLGVALQAGVGPALVRALTGSGAERAESIIVLTALGGAVVVAVVLPLGALAVSAVRAVRARVPPAVRVPLPGDGDSLARDLGGTPLFSLLPQDVLLSLARHATLCSYRPGAVVVRQGEVGDTFFVVRSGRWRVTLEHASGRRDAVAELGPTDAFGEMALLGDGTRQFSVSSVDGGELVALTRGPFQEALTATGVARADVTAWMQTAQWLGRCPLFSGMTPSQRARFLRHGTRRTLAPGEVLIRHGEPGEAFYLVLSGHLCVTSPTGQRLADLGPSDHVGEVALLTSSPRNATVTALDDVVVLALGREPFLDTLARDLHFGAAVSDSARARSGVGP
jgi:CRP-like cAMP-binding protein